jgi:type IV secretion system protein VirB10
MPTVKERAEPTHKDTKLLVFTTSTGHASGGGGAAVAGAPSRVGCGRQRRDRDEAAGFDGSGSCDDDYGIMGSGGYGTGYGGWGGLGGYEPITAAERLARRESLGSRLRPTVMAGASASVLQHQPYLLTMGTMIPCILQTAMDSSLPGLVVCVVPQDVQGKTGITLLDRGTKVVGEFKGGLRQGVERMFVTWTRAETPQGVIVSLDSPGTDPLGRSGLDGEVDYHFWQRFGGAMLISVVDGAMEAGVALASKEGTTTINTGSSEAVVASILQDSINIPPTIEKHQGELVSILVARDLDFRPVYRVLPIKPYEGGGWVPQNNAGADGRVYTK